VRRRRRHAGGDPPQAGQQFIDRRVRPHVVDAIAGVFGIVRHHAARHHAHARGHERQPQARALRAGLHERERAERLAESVGKDRRHDLDALRADNQLQLDGAGHARADLVGPAKHLLDAIEAERLQPEADHFRASVQPQMKARHHAEEAATRSARRAASYPAAPFRKNCTARILHFLLPCSLGGLHEHRRIG